MQVCSNVIYGYFLTTMAGSSGCDREAGPAKPKILTIKPLRKIVCRPLLWTIGPVNILYWINVPHWPALLTSSKERVHRPNSLIRNWEVGWRREAKSWGVWHHCSRSEWQWRVPEHQKSPAPGRRMSDPRKKSLNKREGKQWKAKIKMFLELVPTPSTVSISSGFNVLFK